MENKENKRARNFTDFDKNFLFEIVQGYARVIENKKTDATNVKLENDAWELIAKEFNAGSQSGTRNAKQLHALYDGMKKKARKNLHDDKKEVYKTGGGTFTPKTDALDVKIVDTLQNQFNPLRMMHDSSTSYIEKDVIIFECTESSDEVQENSKLRERPDCTTNTEAVLKDNISHDINLDVPDTSKLQPIPSEAETNVTIPEATPTPSKKRKFILAGNTSEKKETNLNTLTNPLVNRKNFKDETDAKVFNKKINILNFEEIIKNKDIEIKNIELEHLKLKNEMELNYLKTKQTLEIQILQEDLKIKKIESKLKEDLLKK